MEQPGWQCRVVARDVGQGVWGRGVCPACARHRDSLRGSPAKREHHATCHHALAWPAPVGLSLFSWFFGRGHCWPQVRFWYLAHKPKTHMLSLGFLRTALRRT